RWRAPARPSGGCAAPGRIAASGGAVRSPAPSYSRQVTSALAADPHLAPRVVAAEADAGGTTVGTHDGDRRDRDRHVLVDDAALHGGAGLSLVLLDAVHAVDDDLALGREDTHDVALLAPVLAGENLDPVALLDLHRHLENLRGEGDDPHEALVAELTADGAEDARAPRLLLVVDEDSRVLVEAD